MKSSDTVPSMEAIREEGVLVRRAKAGDADAFLELYDAYGDDLYRYVYFRVMNDVAAEAITAHVFGHAWDRLDDHRKRASSFVRWLYSIARNQLVLYYRLNVDAKALGIGCLPAAVDYSLSTDGNDWTNREAWSGHLRLLAAEKQYGLQQTATLLIMRRSLDHLSPGRKAKPSPTFNAYSRSWLTRYLQYHARVPNRAPIVERLVSTYKLFERSVQPRWGQLKQNVSQLGLSLPTLQPAPMRMSVVYAALMFALLFTGTAEAQSALPGDPLYGWKRTSEQAWLSLSPDPVGTGIILANRRLNEWLAVENDPARSSGALSNYIQALTDLSSVGGGQAVSRVVPVLEGHRRRLQNSGLASVQVERSISQAESSVLALADTSTPTAAASVTATAIAPTASLTATATEVLPTISPTATATLVAPTATATATEVPPTFTPTNTPTEVPPTPTDTPTEVPPTPTDTPTEVVPTDTPTAVAPTPTDTPTEIVPTDTPTEVPPTPTETPTLIIPTDTPVPTDTPPGALLAQP